ncbi:hypothetical protein M569_07271, partial [Genlisea aurea]
DSVFDVADIDVVESEEDGSENRDRSCCHMVRGAWFSNDHGMLHYGLPSPLLDHLRRARNPVLQLYPTITKELLESEAALLGDLISTFRGTMDALVDDGSETGNWDVKIAMEFKALQKRIVSSILAVCNGGLRLLESEFINFT